MSQIRGRSILQRDARSEQRRYVVVVPGSVQYELPNIGQQVPSLQEELWMYLHRAFDSNDTNVELCFSAPRELTAPKRFLRKAHQRHERPGRIVIEASQTNREAILEWGTGRGSKTD